MLARLTETFFSAYNFLHEDAVDAIDLTLVATNMAEEIRKESDRDTVYIRVNQLLANIREWSRFLLFNEEYYL